MYLFFFFFQAEDGIRDADVTGVQTCALPIYFERASPRRSARAPGDADEGRSEGAQRAQRLEERRDARVVPRGEEFEGEDRLAPLRRETEHVRDPHLSRFSAADAPSSRDRLRRLRERRR